MKSEFPLWNTNLYNHQFHIHIRWQWVIFQSFLSFSSHFPLFFIYFLFISFIYNRDHWSSLKFNPKRHQLSLTFPCVFRFLSSETLKHMEKPSKVNVFLLSFQIGFWRWWGLSHFQWIIGLIMCFSH